MHVAFAVVCIAVDVHDDDDRVVASYMCRRFFADFSCVRPLISFRTHAN
jgi:hypothetical protein